MSNQDDAQRFRGLPRELVQDIKRAAYEAKVREMEGAAERDRRRPSEGERKDPT